MRIVVVTGEGRHHKQLCVGLAARHDVVGILHPSHSVKKRLQRFRNRARDYGWLYAVMSAAAAGPAWFSGWDDKAEIAAEANARFAEAVDAYTSLPRGLIHRNVDVHTAGPQLLKRLRPEVVIVLGGPVYPTAFLESAQLIVNYHSGISPLYNGASTIRFAFANEHPHLCGGTLMTMNATIDGGAILAHFLPAVESGDTPASLFLKTVTGATTIFDRFLRHLTTSSHFSSVPQPRPLFYCRSVNWTICHRLLADYNVQRDIAREHKRSEEILEYWREPNDLAASVSFEGTLRRLLLGRT